MAHITGGGITENLPRILPKNTAAQIEIGSWPVLPIFEHLRTLGQVSDEEMMRTFNMGVGLIAAIPAEKFKRVKTCSTARKRSSTSSAASSRATVRCTTPREVAFAQQRAWIARTSDRAQSQGTRGPLNPERKFGNRTQDRPVRLGILLSGRGSNFLAIAESIRTGKLSGVEIAVVISNVADAGGIASRASNWVCRTQCLFPKAASAPSTTPM